MQRKIPTLINKEVNVCMFSPNYLHCVFAVIFPQLCFSPLSVVESDGQPRVSRGILWHSRGLISKLPEVGSDLALRNLNHSLPASIPPCCILGQNGGIRSCR